MSQNDALIVTVLLLCGLVAALAHMLRPSAGWPRLGMQGRSPKD